MFRAEWVLARVVATCVGLTGRQRRTRTPGRPQSRRLSRESSGRHARRLAESGDGQAC